MNRHLTACRACVMALSVLLGAAGLPALAQVDRYTPGAGQRPTASASATWAARSRP